MPWGAIVSHLPAATARGNQRTLHLDLLSWLNPAAVWPDAVLLWCRRLDLEGDWLVVRVGDLKGALDELRQRTRESELNMRVKAELEQERKESAARLSPLLLHLALSIVRTRRTYWCF